MLDIDRCSRFIFHGPDVSSIAGYHKGDCANSFIGKDGYIYTATHSLYGGYGRVVLLNNWILSAGFETAGPDTSRSVGLPIDPSVGVAIGNNHSFFLDKHNYVVRVAFHNGNGGVRVEEVNLFPTGCTYFMETVAGRPRVELDVLTVMFGNEHITYGSSGSRVMLETRRGDKVAVATLTGGLTRKIVAERLDLDPKADYAVVSRILDRS